MTGHRLPSWPCPVDSCAEPPPAERGRGTLAVNEPASYHETMEETVDHLDSLAASLKKLGLEVVCETINSLVVSNPALGGDDLGAYSVSPGLRQEVACIRHAEGDNQLWWFWVWPGITKASPPDLEPLCPAGRTNTAAVAIARVLAVLPSKMMSGPQA